jgi:hypothetical protein
MKPAMAAIHHETSNNSTTAVMPHMAMIEVIEGFTACFMESVAGFMAALLVSWLAHQ